MVFRLALLSLLPPKVSLLTRLDLRCSFVHSHSTVQLCRHSGELAIKGLCTSASTPATQPTMQLQLTGPPHPDTNGIQ